MSENAWPLFAALMDVLDGFLDIALVAMFLVLVAQVIIGVLQGWHLTRGFDRPERREARRAR